MPGSPPGFCCFWVPPPPILGIKSYGYVTEMLADCCENDGIIPSWNTFFEKSSPFVQNFCIYTPSKSVAKCGEFQPKTANLGTVCLEQSNFL